jgi:hypothetical protein
MTLPELAGPDPREPSPWSSRRLWSWPDMIRFYVDGFVALACELGRFSERNNNNPQDARKSETRKQDSLTLKGWVGRFSELNFPLSARQSQRIATRCEDDKKVITNQEIATMTTELVNRLADECERLHFLCLSDAEQRLYAPEAPLFGEEVEAKLPLIAEDTAEAGRCLSLSRPTACVFHLMRIMEVATQKLGDALGITLVDQKNWQNILDETNKAIKQLDQKQAKTKALAEVSAHLYGVKIAWRNEVMHPKQTYTVEEADAIFRHVNSFMRELVGIL